MKQKIITKLFQNKEIFFENDLNEKLYLNATKTARSFNKDVNVWKRSKETNEYIASLTALQNLQSGDLIKVVVGGNNKNNQGTWIHKKLIILFARWLNSDFAVWCDLQIEEILSSKNSKPVQTPETFDIKSYTQQNRELIELIELIDSKNAMTLHYLDKLTKQLNLKSPLELLQIDLDSYYFIPTELGKFINKSAVEINKILEAKGFQVKVDEQWQLTESGKKFAIEVKNRIYTQLKWKIEAIA